MNSLVADYGTDSSSESSNEDNFKEKEDEVIEKLPSASFLMDTNTTNGSENSKYSVFTNPFLEAEQAEKSKLEKHVKMTTTINQASTVNGKQICWSFRKGKCRFGQNCKFLHDELITKVPQQDNSENNNTKEQLLDTQNSQDITVSLKRNRNKAGLPRGLVPSKKFYKTYKSA